VSATWSLLASGLGVLAAPGPYSLPWQLRPTTAGTGVRSDTCVASFESPSGSGGTTIASVLHGSFAVAPELAPFVRMAVVGSSEPGSAVGRASAVVNPAVGIVWAKPLGERFRTAVLAAATLPIGEGGGEAPSASAVAAAVSRGVPARSGMDNALFAVNYATGIAGAGIAWVEGGLTVQAEATVLHLVRVRNEDVSKESSRTNFTAGLHAGWFAVPWLSLGVEARAQVWLTTPAFVEADRSARETVTVAAGPRFHLDAGGLRWKPGVAYATALDDPLRSLRYHIVQVDLPVSF
jgi:hypothetical protein